MSIIYTIIPVEGTGIESRAQSQYLDVSTCGRNGITHRRRGLATDVFTQTQKMILCSYDYRQKPRKFAASYILVDRSSIKYNPPFFSTV